MVGAQAVLHHVASPARRLRVLGELARVLRPGGRALLTVWASEQEDARKLAKCASLDASAVGVGRCMNQVCVASSLSGLVRLWREKPDGVHICKLFGRF